MYVCVRFFGCFCKCVYDTQTRTMTQTYTMAYNDAQNNAHNDKQKLNKITHFVIHLKHEHTKDLHYYTRA